MKVRIWLAAGCAAGMAVVVSSFMQVPGSRVVDAVIPAATASTGNWQKYAGLPMAFERNAGQTDEQVRYFARGAGYGLFLTDTEAVFSLQATQRDGGPSRSSAPAVIRMSLAGGNPKPQIEALGVQAGRSHYLQGNDSAQWKRDVARYDRVRYRGVYPGVDLVYYGNQQQLEYDFIVAPRRDPAAIAMDFAGIESLQLDASGNLILKTAQGAITQHKPVVYQEIGGRRSAVAASYRLIADNRVGFEIGHYDRNRPLVIDPVLAYSTYLGGNGDDNVAVLAVDDLGNLYVTGSTASTNFPLKGALKTNNAGGTDVFVTKFNSDGNGLVYSTYLGGGGQDVGLGMAVDAGGNVYLTGYTVSTDFPVTGAVQTTHGADSGQADAFVAKLNATGSSLVYGSYLGGTGGDQGFAIDLDRSGNVYVAGSTGSVDFPLALAMDATLDGGTDGFVTKLSGSGASILYSTLLGGVGDEQVIGMEVDAIPTRPGVVYLTGHTSSSNYPVNPSDTLQTELAGGKDAFVTLLVPQIDSPGMTLGFSSYLGTLYTDQGNDIAVNANGDAIVVGRTTGNTFPILNAAQGTSGGGSDGFVAKFNFLNAGNWIYSTYVGGAGDDQAREVEIDASGYAYVVGFTDSTDLPGPTPELLLQHTNAGGYDVFAGRYSPSGYRLWMTYLGGTGDDFGYAIALQGNGSIFLGGLSASTNLPVRTPYQASNRGAGDAFVVRLGVRSLRTAAQDFDGDLIGDLLWRNTGNGTNAIWRSANSATPQTVASAALAWNIAGVGDFDGDGKSDILWRNGTTGSNVIWRSGNSSTPLAVTAVTATAWQIVGVGDFNYDYKADILWRNASNGTNAIWLSGNYATQQAVTAVTNLAWKVAGLGDFNGDNKADILWRNENTGTNAIWLSGNSTTQQTITGVTNLSWKVAGVGDFLGDGKSDIFWRNAGSGANVIWRSGAYDQQQSLPAINLDWNVVAINDYNGDARSDVLWRDGRTGTNVIWRSASPTNQQPVSSVVSLAWKAVP